MITVSRLPRDPGPAGWNAILPAADKAEPLAGSLQSDMLIIGAGFAGLSAARRLRQLAPSARIIVLEATRVGDGPAGRNSGFMIDLPHDLASDDYGGAVEKDHALIRANRAAIAFARDAAADYGMPDEAFRQSGKINAAATRNGLAHNESYARHLSSLGETFELHDAERMREITGTGFFRGGLYTPHAAMIQPALYIRSLAGGLLMTGIALFENSPVTELERLKEGWRAITPGGDVTAGKVILAVNGHAESFGFFRRQLMHVFTYASMTRALTTEEVRSLGGAADWAATPADPLGTTVRRISGTGGDRIVIRNRFTCDPSMEIDDRRLTAISQTHHRSFTARFPMLRDMEMEYCWGGRLCLSRNDTPAFGEMESGLFAACCQNGLGTARGTAAGIAAAELCCGEDSPMVRHHLNAAPPVKLPPELITRLGATAVIRWGELKAGREF